MFFGGKRTGYLALYEQNEKIKSVGFIQICGMNSGIHITAQIKNAGEKWEGDYPLYLSGNFGKLGIGNITLSMGRGTFEREICAKGDALIIDSYSLQPEDIECVKVQLTESEDIWGAFYRDISREKKQEEVNEDKRQEKVVEREQEVSGQLRQLEFTDKPEVVLPEQFCADKWEQILKQYKNVHPFGDNRLFVTIEPKDFIILTEPYQRLVHNSFLLHGFYNYRHLILGKDCRIGNSEETCFYLGVPGVFFEREKQVAIMFGFEGFECAGPVDIGNFGYYMREVAI